MARSTILVEIIRAPDLRLRDEPPSSRPSAARPDRRHREDDPAANISRPRLRTPDHVERRQAARGPAGEGGRERHEVAGHRRDHHCQADDAAGAGPVESPFVECPTGEDRDADGDGQRVAALPDEAVRAGRRQLGERRPEHRAHERAPRTPVDVATSSSRLRFLPARPSRPAIPRPRCRVGEW